MSVLESKISDEILVNESILSPIREYTNKKMYIYGDTDFRPYILSKSIYFSLDHAVHLSEDKRLALYKLLKLNTK